MKIRDSPTNGNATSAASLYRKMERAPLPTAVMLLLLFSSCCCVVAVSDAAETTTYVDSMTVRAQTEYASSSEASPLQQRLSSSTTMHVQSECNVTVSDDTSVIDMEIHGIALKVETLGHVVLDCDTTQPPDALPALLLVNNDERRPLSKLFQQLPPSQRPTSASSLCRSLYEMDHMTSRFVSTTANGTAAVTTLAETEPTTTPSSGEGSFLRRKAMATGTIANPASSTQSLAVSLLTQAGPAQLLDHTARLVKLIPDSIRVTNETSVEAEPDYDASLDEWNVLDGDSDDVCGGCEWINGTTRLLRYEYYGDGAQVAILETTGWVRLVALTKQSQSTNGKAKHASKDGASMTTDHADKENGDDFDLSIGKNIMGWKIAKNSNTTTTQTRHLQAVTDNTNNETDDNALSTMSVTITLYWDAATQLLRESKTQWNRVVATTYATSSSATEAAQSTQFVSMIEVIATRSHVKETN